MAGKKKPGKRFEVREFRYGDKLFQLELRVVGDRWAVFCDALDIEVRRDVLAEAVEEVQSQISARSGVVWMLCLLVTLHVNHRGTGPAGGEVSFGVEEIEVAEGGGWWRYRGRTTTTKGLPYDRDVAVRDRGSLRIVVPDNDAVRAKLREFRDSFMGYLGQFAEAFQGWKIGGGRG